MKVFDKIRDLFTEEVEVEEPIKKEVIQVEIPAPEISKKEDKESFKKEEVEENLDLASKENKNNTVFFDEDDFDDIEKTRELKEIKRETKKDVYKEPYQEKREVYKEYKDPYAYKPIKEEKKHFSPTPVISPVFGVLDKNYKKDEIIEKPKRYVNKDNSITLDDVRNKAYGTLEDELESTLFGKTSIMFATREEKNDYDSLEEELKNAADALDLLREDPVLSKDEYKNEEEDNNKDIDDLLEDDFSDDKEVLDDKEDLLEDDILDNDFKSDDKLSESDLFNLIDDMYEGDK